MTRIAVIYFSGSGTTRALAQLVEEGVRQVTSDCAVHDISGADIQEGRWANEAVAEQLDGCDGIIFGTPTYMGGVSSQLKSFFDAMAPRWYTQAWNGKAAGAFTVSSLASGDKLNALQDISAFAMQMGMIWTGTGVSLKDQLNPNGFYLGLGAVASTPEQIQEVDANSAKHFGQRVASIAAKLA